MKRILILPVAALVITACVATTYVWQSELDGPVIISADIQKVAENRYILSKRNIETLSFYELNNTGDLQPVGQQIPTNHANDLQLHWLDDSAFFAARNFGVIAYGSIEGGLEWQLDNAAFNAITGLNVALLSYQVKPTSHRAGLVYGRAATDNSDSQFPIKFVGFVAEISEQGQSLGAYTDPRFSELTVLQELNNTYLVKGLLAQDQGDMLGYREVIQQRNRNGEVLLELPLHNYTNFVLAMDDRMFIAVHEDEATSIRVLDWGGNQISSFPISSRDFHTSGKARLTSQNELLLTNYNEIEKRTLDGQLIWYHPIDRAHGLRQVFLDSGLSANTVDNSSTTKIGVELEVKKAENGDLLFRGTGKQVEKNMPAFEVFNPHTGKKRTIQQNGLATVYEITSCSNWCTHAEIEYQAGVCAIHDIELLEDGSLITVGSHCNNEGTADRLQVTRY